MRRLPDGTEQEDTRLTNFVRELGARLVKGKLDQSKAYSPEQRKQRYRSIRERVKVAGERAESILDRLHGFQVVSLDHTADKVDWAREGF